MPKGKDVGGAFQQIPLCHSAAQIGCADHVRVVPLDDAAAGEHAVRQGAGSEHGRGVHESAALAGGSGELHAYLDATGRTITGDDQAEAVGDAGEADRHAVGQRARVC